MSDGRRAPMRRIAVAAVLVALAGSVAAIAAWAGAFNDTDRADGAQVATVAERYAAALTSGKSGRLEAVTCRQPTEGQAKAFERRAGGGSLRWLVHRQPAIADDVASGTLRATAGTKHRDYPFTLHRRAGGWCAHYNWGRLDEGAEP